MRVAASAALREHALAQLKSGDKVVWNTSDGETRGRVVKNRRPPPRSKVKVAASKGNPEYIVKSDKSGKTAAHKPSQLKEA
jgi:hypothetical protein